VVVVVVAVVVDAEDAEEERGQTIGLRCFSVGTGTASNRFARREYTLVEGS
jgi:hypothetical protein